MELRQVLIRRVAPGGAKIAEVGERIAQCGHLPVDQSRNPSRSGRGNDRVAEPRVTVDKRGLPGLRPMPPQPGLERIDLGHLTRFVVFPKACKAPELALQVAA